MIDDVLMSAQIVAKIRANLLLAKRLEECRVLWEAIRKNDVFHFWLPNITPAPKQAMAVFLPRKNV